MNSPRSYNEPASGSVVTERGALFLALLSGALQGATLPPFDAWPLAFVSVAPLLVATRGRTPARAFGLGLLQGFVVYLVASATWLPSTIASIAEVGRASSLALALFVFLWHAVRMALVMA